MKPNYRKELIKYYKEECSDLLLDFYTYEYTNSRRVFLKDKELNSEEGLIIYSSFDKWLTLMMDIYVLSRILYIVQTNKSKTIACYVGSNHAYSYNYFFTKFLNSKPLWMDDKSQPNNEEERKSHRCVRVPSKIQV